MSPLRSGAWWNIVDRYHQRPYIASHCCNRDSGGVYYVSGINDRPGKPNPVTVKADAVWFRPWSAAAGVYLDGAGATAVENTMVCLGMVARETALSDPCSGAGIFLQHDANREDHGFVGRNGFSEGYDLGFPFDPLVEGLYKLTITYEPNKPTIYEVIRPNGVIQRGRITLKKSVPVLVGQTYTPVLAFMTRGTDGVRVMGVDYVRFTIPNENGY